MVKALLGLLLFLAVVSTGLFTSAPSDAQAAPPTVTIEAPERRSTQPTTFTAHGTATEATRVEVNIQNITTGEWLHSADGTYNPTFATNHATLTNNNWTLDLTNLEPGDHGFSVRTFNNNELLTRTYTRTTIEAPANTGGQLTILYSRSQWGVPDRNCSQEGPSGVHPLGINLLELADLMQERGLTATSSAVYVRHLPTEPKCVNIATYTAPWSVLAELRDDYGWSLASHGVKRIKPQGLTEQELYDETCGSLPRLASRGHTEVDLFLPKSANTPQELIDVVNTCFTYQRQYSSSSANDGSPGVVSVVSINGGHCTAPGCDVSVFPDRAYKTPQRFIELVDVAAGDWSILQGYRFVTGSDPAPFSAWNCEGPPEEHWTNEGELYCLDDWLSILDAIPDDVEIVSPTQMAERVNQ